MQPNSSALSRIHTMVPRVERHHRIVEEIRASAPRPVSATRLATALGVSVRSIERDVSGLRAVGLPIVATPGPGGGYRLATAAGKATVELTAGEMAALIASMVGIGPLASATAQSALDKLVAAVSTS